MKTINDETRPADTGSPTPVSEPTASPAVPAGSLQASMPAAPSSKLPSASPIRLCGESPRAFESFCAYLELGPRRRSIDVATRVGAALRTVKRWASDFRWKKRIESYVADRAGEFVETESDVRREEILDAAARTKELRDRQLMMAGAFLDAAERYVESLESDDVDRMSFSEACRALQIAAQITGPAPETIHESDDPMRAWETQISTLLDRAYGQAMEKCKADGNSATQKTSP